MNYPCLFVDALNEMRSNERDAKNMKNVIDFEFVISLQVIDDGYRKKFVFWNVYSFEKSC